MRGRRPGHRVLAARTSAAAGALALLLATVQCRGPAGPPGDDAPEYDHTPPVAMLVSPDAQRIYGDTLALVAKVAGADTGEVDSLWFMVGDSSAHPIRESIPGAVRYRADRLFSDFGVPPGGEASVLVAVRDTLHRTTFTGPRLVTRVDLSAPDTLASGAIRGTSSSLTLPDSVTVSTGGGTTQRRLVGAFGVRFQPAFACTVHSAFLMPTRFGESPSGGLADSVEVLVATASKGDTLPATPIDSAVVALKTLDAERWVEVSFAPEAVIPADQPLFLLIRPAEPAVNDSSAGLRLASILRGEGDSALGPVTLRHEAGPDTARWVELTDRPVPLRREKLRLRVVVTYDAP